jgi:hypothetical protein
MPFTKSEARLDQLMGYKPIRETTIRSLTKIANAIEGGGNDLKWARKVAATVLGLPEDAVWLYGPCSDRAARSDKLLSSLRQEWIESGEEFLKGGMLLE